MPFCEVGLVELLGSIVLFISQSLLVWFRGGPGSGDPPPYGLAFTLVALVPFVALGVVPPQGERITGRPPLSCSGLL